MLTRSCFTEGTSTTGKAWRVTGSLGGSSSEALLEEMEGPVPPQATRTRTNRAPRLKPRRSLALYAAPVDGTVAHEPDVFLCGTPDDCSMILSLCIKSFVRKILIIAHLALLALLSPLLSSLHCMLGVLVCGRVSVWAVWAWSTWRERRTFPIDFLSYFQLISVFLLWKSRRSFSYWVALNKNCLILYSTAWQDTIDYWKGPRVGV